MSEGISSNTDEVVSHAAELSSGNPPASLEAIEGDTTMPGFKIHKTYEELCTAYTKIMASLKTDAENIEGVAYLYASTDSLAGQGFFEGAY